MLRRVQNFAKKFSRLQMLKNNFNRWKNGSNAAALRKMKIYNKPWGAGYIEKYERNLTNAIRNNAHNKAGNFERQWRNMKNTARREATRVNRDPHGRLEYEIRGSLS